MPVKLGHGTSVDTDCATENTPFYVRSCCIRTSVSNIAIK